MADWGLTANSSTTLQHAIYSADQSSTPPIVCKPSEPAVSTHNQHASYVL